MTTRTGCSVFPLRAQVRPYLGLLRDPSLSSLLASKFVTRVARDALLFALVIGIVKETGSTRDTTLAVLAYTVPSVVLGLIAGAIAERAAVRPLLLAGHVCRACVVLAMLWFGTYPWVQYVLLAGFATCGLFVGPAEASALPRLVERDDLNAAHSLESFLQMIASVVGALAVGPVLFAVTGWSAVIMLSAGLHLVAAAVVLGVHAPHGDQLSAKQGAAASAILLGGWRSIHRSPSALTAFGYVIVALSLGKVLWALAPYYTQDVLGLSPEKTVFIAAPAALGAAVALALTPVMGRLLGVRRTVDIGFFALVLAVLSVGSVVYGSDFVLTHVELHVGYIEERVGPSPLIVLTMLAAIPAGLGSTMLGIASATTLNQEIPADVQARAVAAGGTLSNAVSLVPLFGVAVAAGLLGVRGLLLTVTVAAFTGAMLLRGYSRQLALSRTDPMDPPTDR